MAIGSQPEALLLSRAFVSGKILVLRMERGSTDVDDITDAIK